LHGSEPEVFRRTRVAAAHVAQRQDSGEIY
jgi:hypothetical protein